MISNEQMDTLIGRLKVYGSESGRGKDHPNAIACRTAASVIIEQKAEIERLREALRNAWVHMHAAGTALRMMPKDTIWPADFIRATERIKQALETQ